MKSEDDMQAWVNDAALKQKHWEQRAKVIARDGKALWSVLMESIGECIDDYRRLYQGRQVKSVALELDEERFSLSIRKTFNHSSALTVILFLEEEEIRFSWAGRRDELRFDVDQHGKLILWHKERAVEIDQAAEIILRPFLFNQEPSLPEMA